MHIQAYTPLIICPSNRFWCHGGCHARPHGMLHVSILGLDPSQPGNSPHNSFFDPFDLQTAKAVDFYAFFYFYKAQDNIHFIVRVMVNMFIHQWPPSDPQGGDVCGEVRLF